MTVDKIASMILRGGTWILKLKLMILIFAVSPVDFLVTLPPTPNPKPHFVFVFITIPFPSFSLSPHYSILAFMYPRFLITSTSIQWFSSELFSLCTCAHKHRKKATVDITQTQRRILLMIFFASIFSLAKEDTTLGGLGEFLCGDPMSAWQRINKDSHKRARNGARLIFLSFSALMFWASCALSFISRLDYSASLFYGFSGSHFSFACSSY